MSRLDDDTLRILDDESHPAIIIGPGEAEGLDEAEVLAIIVSKSNGDGAIVGLSFTEDAVALTATVYAEGDAAQRTVITSKSR